MPPHIPTELYEAIIDQADRATLKNCALVCRALRRRCQKILFSRITLGAPPDRLYLKSRLFYDIISSYPHLCLYVDALAISELDQLTWIAVDHYVGRILPTLLHLKELAIVGRVAQWGRLNFNKLSDDFRAALLTKCRSPHLIILKLTNILNVPLHMLQLLESLTLSHCSVNHDSNAEFDGTAAPMILRNLSLVRWRSIIQWFYIVRWVKGGKLDITQLSTLRLDIKALDEPPLPQVSRGLDDLKVVIEQCSSTVESIELLCPDSVILASYDLLDLATMPRLRTLVLHGHVRRRGVPANAGLQWHIDTLRKIPSHHRFETISLLFDIEDDISIESSGFANDTNWSGFVAVMQGLHERTLALNVTFHVRNARGPYVHDVIQDKLGVLRPLGVLSIEQTMITTDLVLFGA